MTTTDNDLLKHQVQAIVKHLEFPEVWGENDEGYDEDSPVMGYDYLRDCLDIKYTVDSERNYVGARVLVCFGGPNVYIDTNTNTVEGYWWGSEYSEVYIDNIDLDDALKEIWEMGA